MNKFITTIVLIALLLSSIEAKQAHHKKNKHHAKPDYSKYTDQQIKSTFAELKNSEAGLEVFTTIQLEMTSGNGDWIDTSLEVLQELNSNTQAQIQSLNQNLNSRRNYCDEKLDEVRASIYRNEKSIAEAAANIPVMQEEQKVKAENQQRLEDELDVKHSLIDTLEEENQEGRANYVASRRDHDDMISTLAQAQVYIAALKENNFLQKSNSPVLAQIQTHAKASIDLLQQQHHRSMFFYLAEVSNSLSTQADGKLVDKVLDLIDELIDYEQNAKQIDFEVEELRQEKYNDDLKNLVDQVETIGTMINFLKENVAAIYKKVKLTQDTADEERGFVVLKNNELTDLDRSCSNDVESIQIQVSSNRQMLAIINECVGLFQAKAKELRKSIQSI